MRRTRRARQHHAGDPCMSYTPEATFETTCLEFVQKFALSSPDGRRGNRPLPMAGFDGRSGEEHRRAGKLLAFFFGFL